MLSPVAGDAQIAVGDAGRRTDRIAGRNARIPRHGQIAIDRAEARDDAVGGRINVSIDRDAGAAAVAADHHRAAIHIDAAGEVGRAIE
ncbi:hypothetical protein G6F65_021821 [Rhizopus arrhizus]|nr:hypothetical protein G6F65_021821 [Rhizopus arrhizus]